MQAGFTARYPKPKLRVFSGKLKRPRARFRSEVWHSFWTSVKNFDAYPYLQNACIPICEVFGGLGQNALTEEKLCIPPNPNIQWVWIPNAGHYLPHERPSEVAGNCGSRRAPCISGVHVVAVSYASASGISTGKSSRSPHSFQDPM